MATHFFHSGMVGAPTNTNQAGSTLAIIRACLSTGFNLLTPQAATVASGVMTISYSAPHGYEGKVLIRLDGAPGGSIVKRVTTTAGSNSLTIPVTGFADGAVPGSLSTRVAPAGWDEPFTDTGVGVFRSPVVGPGCTRFFYRVSDSSNGGAVSMLRGYESMTDANTGTGQFPTVAQVSGDGVIVERSNSSTPRYWAVFADARTVYFFIESSAADRVTGGVFGDAEPYGGADMFCAVAGSGSLSSSASLYSPRASSGAGSAVTVMTLLPFGIKSGERTSFASVVEGGFVLSNPVMIMGGGSIRGALRGLMHSSTNNMTASQRYIELSDIVGTPGRVLLTRDASGDGGAVAFGDEDWA